jgi:hypothetical protein
MKTPLQKKSSNAPLSKYKMKHKLGEDRGAQY